MRRLILILLFATVLHGQDVHVHVNPNGNNAGDGATAFATIQYAMDHAPQPGPEGRLYVHIADGVYAERVMVTANRPRTTLLGSAKNPAAVVITASQNAKSVGGTFFSETVDIEAPEFEADGVTFANTAVATGQAVAIAVRSDRAIFKHCRFIGDQDTLFADFGRQYYTESYISGGVDFIFGNAAAVFDQVEIHELRPGYLTAQSRTSGDQATGFVIANSKVTADDLGGKGFYLGRPWRKFSRVVVMNTVLPEQLNASAWSPWREGETMAYAFYGEFGNAGPGAEKAKHLTFGHELTPKDAASFAAPVFLRGADNWNAVTEAARLP